MSLLDLTFESAWETLGQSCFLIIVYIVVARFSSTFAGNRVINQPQQGSKTG
jgi:hypothetical protein